MRNIPWQVAPLQRCIGPCTSSFWIECCRHTAFPGNAIHVHMGQIFRKLLTAGPMPTVPSRQAWFKRLNYSFNMWLWLCDDMTPLKKLKLGVKHSLPVWQEGENHNCHLFFIFSTTVQAYVATYQNKCCTCAKTITTPQRFHIARADRRTWRPATRYDRWCIVDTLCLHLQRFWLHSVAMCDNHHKWKNKLMGCFFGDLVESLFICASDWFDLIFYLKIISILILTDIQPLCKYKCLLKWEPI